MNIIDINKTGHRTDGGVKGGNDMSEKGNIDDKKDDILHKSEGQANQFGSGKNVDETDNDQLNKDNGNNDTNSNNDTDKFKNFRKLGTEQSGKLINKDGGSKNGTGPNKQNQNSSNNKNSDNDDIDNEFGPRIRTVSLMILQLFSSREKTHKLFLNIRGLDNLLPYLYQLYLKPYCTLQEKEKIISLFANLIYYKEIQEKLRSIINQLVGSIQNDFIENFKSEDVLISCLKLFLNMSVNSKYH